MTNSYATTLAKALGEVRHYANTEEGQTYFSGNWGRHFISLVEKAMLASDDSEAEDSLETIIRMWIDSGPMENNIMPSLDAAIDAMQRKRSRRK